MDDIVARIDEATTPRCVTCMTLLSADGPSPDFCGPACQHAWADLLVTNPREVYGRRDSVPDLVATGLARWREEIMSNRIASSYQRMALEFDTIPIVEVGSVGPDRLTAGVPGWVSGRPRWPVVPTRPD